MGTLNSPSGHFWSSCGAYEPLSVFPKALAINELLVRPYAYLEGKGGPDSQDRNRPRFQLVRPHEAVVTITNHDQAGLSVPKFSEPVTLHSFKIVPSIVCSCP